MGLGMIEGKTVFVTGGAGFIGCCLLGRLLEKNKVIVYDNLFRNTLEKTSYGSHKNLTFIKGDVLDFPALVSAMKGAEIIVHCAGIAGIDTVIKDPVNTMDVNLIGTSNLLKAASAQPKCDRVVTFSTSEVFGQMAFRSSETDSPVVGSVGEARWTYAVSKLAAEHLAIAYNKRHGLPTSVVRPFNVYGPGQVGEGAMRIFVQKALNNETIQIHGDGTQIRAWCFVDDMVEGVLLTATHPNAIGETFNIGNQRAVTTIYGLANNVVRVLGSSSKIEFVRKDYVDIELRVPEVTKAKEKLGFEAKVDLDEGISRTGEYYRSIAL